MTEVKGATIKDFPRYVKEILGEEAYQKWLSTLPDESKKIFSSQILSSKWYSFRYCDLEPQKKIAELFYNNDPISAQKVGRWQADSAFTGIYKAFVKIGSPSFIISNASNLMTTFYRPTKLEVVEKEKNHVKIRITQFPEIEEITEQNIYGFIIRTMEICGCHNIQAKVNFSLAKGDAFTEIEGSWQ